MKERALHILSVVSITQQLNRDEAVNKFVTLKLTNLLGGFVVNNLWSSNDLFVNDWSSWMNDWSSSMNNWSGSMNTGAFFANNSVESDRKFNWNLSKIQDI